MPIYDDYQAVAVPAISDDEGAVQDAKDQESWERSKTASIWPPLEPTGLERMDTPDAASDHIPGNPGIGYADPGGDEQDGTLGTPKGTRCAAKPATKPRSKAS